ncbi:MAG: cytochrome c [Nitrospirota bacterium]|nr:cytochrome c [Nitrospirota bacterium]
MRWGVLLAILFAHGTALAADAGSRVETNYMFFCAQCHGEKGDGKGLNAQPFMEAPPATLSDPDFMGKFTDEQIFRTLTFGGPVNNLSSLMPPWGNRLTPEERWELIHYIRALCQCKGPGGGHGP